VIHDGYATPLDESSASAAREILNLVADADAVLATGHLSGDECAWLLSEARHHGVTRMPLTHPAYTVPGLSPARIRELADFGAKVEITAYQLLLQPGMPSSPPPRLLDAPATSSCSLPTRAILHSRFLQKRLRT
jgi:hypothetical protein